MTAARANHRRHVAVFELAVERARFEADRARRQFDAVEPENRLVARTLERSLEKALVAQRQAEANLVAQRLRQPTRLSDEETGWLERAGADVRAVFHAPTTTWRERRQLLRAIIAEVVVTVQEKARQAEVDIVWEGGAATAFVLDLNKTGKHFRTTDEETVELARRLAERYDDRTIAIVLSRQGRRTGTGLPFTKTRVKTLREYRNIAAYQPSESVTPQDDDVPVLSITAAERTLGVNRTTLSRWLKDGFIQGEQLTPAGPWHIRITDELLRRIVPEVPEGWLPLDQAANALGLARQTVLHKVQRGELEAVHVNKGKRKGLRIKVEPREPGLFGTPQ